MIQGSIVALVTPMDNSGRIDTERLANLVEFHIAQGTDALVAVGTTGESATLSKEEDGQVIKFVIEQVAGRIPVIAGTGSNATSEAIDFTRNAYELGADACLIVTPYYNKPTQEGLFLHHQAIAEAVNIPQILYNVPSRTACDMLPETVARLAKTPNIVGIKEATGDLSRLQTIRQLTSPEFALYTGDDASSCAFCLQGGNGSITVTGNVAPRLVHQMIQAALAGDQAAAETIDAALTSLHKVLFIQSNPIPVKWAVAEMGLISQGIRLPLTWLSDEYHAPVRSAMQEAGVI
jgi:4-hydroxy-tetrahydrodipicolinate synthase